MTSTCNNSKPAKSGLGLIDRAVVLTLERRADRLAAFWGGWRAVDGMPIPEPEVFVGIDGKKITVPKRSRLSAGAHGNALSMINLFSRALSDGVDNLLLFEDDCIFATGFAGKFVEALEMLPADYDALYLGGNVRNAVSRTPLYVDGTNGKLVYAWKATATHACLFSRRFMEMALDWISRDPLVYPCDATMAYGAEMEGLVIICCNPPICGQRGGVDGGGSDIARSPAPNSYWPINPKIKIADRDDLPIWYSERVNTRIEREMDSE